MVTRDDVARRAGTSTAVVSYVVNNGPKPVAAATRARVLQAVEELGYRPNAIARALRAQRSNLFGLVVSDIGNPFLGELARAIEVAAFEHGYTVLFGNTMVDEDREVQYLRHFIDRRADGLLIVPVGLRRPMINELNAAGIPMLVLDRPVSGLRATTIIADNRAGATTAVRHLLDHGHRRIGCIAGPPQLVPTEERLRAFEAVMEDVGLRVGPVERSRIDRQAGYEAATRVLARKRRPTALFVTTDEQAMGVLRAAADLGLRLPDDLAVVAFDGIRAGLFSVPGLTTVMQPIAEIGVRAVEALLDGASGRRRKEVVPVTLVRRRSCGCPEALLV